MSDQSLISVCLSDPTRPQRPQVNDMCAKERQQALEHLEHFVVSFRLSLAEFFSSSRRTSLSGDELAAFGRQHSHTLCTAKGATHRCRWVGDGRKRCAFPGNAAEQLSSDSFSRERCAARKKEPRPASLSLFAGYRRYLGLFTHGLGCLRDS